jgi:anti-anti-sigma factor
MPITVLSNTEKATKLKLTKQMTFSDINAGADPLVKLLGDDVYSGKVLIDMSESDYIDSSGVGWLIASNKRFNQSGGKLLIHSLQPQVRKIFSVLQMQHVLNLRENDNELD